MFGQTSASPLGAAPGRSSAPPAEPTPAPVEIAIGRVEIRFAPPAPEPAKAPSHAVGPPPLADLLRGRRGDAQ